MKISVVIPTYNSAKLIEPTLEAVFRQTLPADEILVLDDGSTDATQSVLERYAGRIAMRRQANCGVAAARNALCQWAQGELVAFLDHDDLWHPHYLETQYGLFAKYPSCVGFFSGHVPFSGYGRHEWEQDPLSPAPNTEVLDPATFFVRYNDTPGYFGSASFICIPKRTLQQIGAKPFCEEASGVDDASLCSRLPLLGSVVYNPERLVAYRIIQEAQSHDKLKAFRLWIRVFEALEEDYRKSATPKLNRLFHVAFASKRRQYAKRLMAAGNADEARRQLRASFGESSNVASALKSGALLLLTYMPTFLQPAWPPTTREWPSPVK